MGRRAEYLLLRHITERQLLSFLRTFSFFLTNH